MRLEFDFEKVIELVDATQLQAFSRLKRTILSVMMRQKDLLFDKSQDPDGSPWQKLSPLREKQKLSKGNKKSMGQKILVDTGTLRNSLSRANAANGIQETEPDIVLGTQVEYAAIHNYGGKIKHNRMITIIPQRQFMGFGNEDEKVVNELVLDFLDEAQA